MNAPPPITSFETLGVHLWHMQQHLEGQSKQINDELRGIKDTISGLATKEELRQLEARVSKGSFSERLKLVAQVCAGIVVIVTVLGLAVELVHRWDALKPVTPQIAKP